MNDSLRIPVTELKSTFKNILVKHGFTPEKAEQCAALFTANSVDGVYTHSVNRFPRFIDYITKGYIKTDAEPTVTNTLGGLEQWEGNLAPGPLNAMKATDRVMELAQQYGIGCVALAHTNHWMRGGYYGWQAAKKGFVFIGFTNTIANMPTFGALDCHLGNNPIVLAVPYKDDAIVLDMAMSQYSYGSLEAAKMKGEELPFIGGYDTEGNLTKDPAEIIKTERPLPIGYWKGAGLSLLLDILSAVLSGGLSTFEVSKKSAEYAVSQVFIAIDLSKLAHHSTIPGIIENIITDYHKSIPEKEGKRVRFPGERVVKTREENIAEGVPVLQSVWDHINSL